MQSTLHFLEEILASNKLDGQLESMMEVECYHQEQKIRKCNSILAAMQKLEHIKL